MEKLRNRVINALKKQGFRISLNGLQQTRKIEDISKTSYPTKLIDTIQKVPLKKAKGKKIMITDKEGKSKTATIVIKPVRCGKSKCTKCPHHIYAYAQWRAGDKIKSKYLGIAR